MNALDDSLPAGQEVLYGIRIFAALDRAYCYSDPNLRTRNGNCRVVICMSKPTVEIPVAWLEKLLRLSQETLVFHDGVLQQPKDHEVAALLGYIGSIHYLLPDSKGEDR